MCGSHQVPLDYGQTKLLQTFCGDDSYDYPMISDLPKYVFRSSKFYFVWYTQQLIVADTTFSVPRSSSYTHQVSDCQSNLVTTVSSSSDLTSKSVPNLSLSFLCIIILILDEFKIEMTKDPSMHHARENGSISMGRSGIVVLRMGSIPVLRIFMELLSAHTTSTSLVVPIRAYLNIKPQRYMNKHEVVTLITYITNSVSLTVGRVLHTSFSVI